MISDKNKELKDGELLSKLLDENIISENNDGKLTTSNKFDKRSKNFSLDDRAEDGYWIIDRLQSLGVPNNIVNELMQRDHIFFRRLFTIEEICDELRLVDIIKLTVVLNQFDSLTPPANGTPDPFLAVHGKTLPILLAVFPVAVVYVWREDCEECDLVHDDLIDIFQKTDLDVALFSIYGPQCASFMERSYSVVGGPTLLFFANGTIDSRLQGAHYRQVIENEIREMMKTVDDRDNLLFE